MAINSEDLDASADLLPLPFDVFVDNHFGRPKNRDFTVAPSSEVPEIHKPHRRFQVRMPQPELPTKGHVIVESARIDQIAAMAAENGDLRPH